MSSHQINTLLPTPASKSTPKFPFNKPLMTQNRQFLIKDLPKYDVAMTVKNEPVDEVQLLHDTMRDLEQMRVVETELDERSVSMDQMGAHLIEEKPIDV